MDLDRLEGLNVRAHYMFEYPKDKLGADINPDITLREFYDVLKNGEDCYEALGVVDSVIREGLFTIISAILEVDYDVIYYTWLKI